MKWPGSESLQALQKTGINVKKLVENLKGFSEHWVRGAKLIFWLSLVGGFSYIYAVLIALILICVAEQMWGAEVEQYFENLTLALCLVTVPSMVGMSLKEVRDLFGRENSN